MHLVTMVLYAFYIFKQLSTLKSTALSTVVIRLLPFLFVIVLLQYACRARERRKSFAKQKHVVPRFPKTPDTFVRTENLEKRRVLSRHR